MLYHVSDYVRIYPLSIERELYELQLLTEQFVFHEQRFSLGFASPEACVEQHLA